MDILVSDDQMVRAFTRWDRLFREDPRGFKSIIESILSGEKSEEYGKSASEYFKTLLVDVR